MTIAAFDRKLASAQHRTAQEIGAINRHLSSATHRSDLADWVNASLPAPLRAVNDRTLNAMHETSELLRQRSGVNPAGLWYPLAGLRDLTTTSAANLVTAKLQPAVTASLLPNSAFVGGGATVLTGLNGSTFAIPKFSTQVDASAGWVAEGSNGADLSPEFGQAVLVPKQLLVSINVSRRLLMNTEFDLDAFLRSELDIRISRALDQAAINGQGGAQPSGLLSASDLTVLAAGANGAAPIWDHPVELEYTVNQAAGGTLVSPAWIASPKLVKKMRKTPRVSGQDGFIFEGGELLGQRVNSTPSAPDNLTKGTSSGVCSALIFGDLSEFFIGFWGPAAVDLLLDATTLIKDGYLRLHARAEVGMVMRRPGAFAAYKDLLAA